MGKKWKQWQISFSWAPKPLWMVTVGTHLKDVCFLEEKLTNLDSLLNCREITFLTKVCIVQAMVFPVVMHRFENWTIKKVECQRTDAFQLWYWRRLLRVLWATRKSNQSVLKEINQSWIVLGRTDAEAEAPILWPPYTKNWLTEKDPDPGKDWGQEVKGVTEDKMVGWHHYLNGHEFE